MLFNKKMEPSCSYCRNGSIISNTEVVCRRRGIVSKSGACPKFWYDPLKRQPAEPLSLNTENLSAKDFEL